MEIYIDNRQDKIELTQVLEELIKKAICASLEEEARTKNYEVSVSLVDNKEIRDLNKQYRNVDSATDVLSFPMDEDFGIGAPFLGDIIISVEKAMEQSKEYGHTIDREIAYLVVHSMFHLMGYDHLTKSDKDLMRKKEKSVMKYLNIYKASEESS